MSFDSVTHFHENIGLQSINNYFVKKKKNDDVEVDQNACLLTLKGVAQTDCFVMN